VKYQPPQQGHSAETAATITRLKYRIKRLEEALELGVGPKRAKELLDGNKDCTAMADEALAKEAKS
jgi:hypothetical protein